MTLRRIILLMAAVSLGGAPARAGEIWEWEWTHEAAGEGWANVFDGGAVVSDSGATGGPLDWDMHFLAADRIPAGAQTASYSTSGSSWVALYGETRETLRISVDFGTRYYASSHIGADRPGGEGRGSMWAVIEFFMPADELEWSWSFSISQGAGFSGTVELLVENLTRSETLFDWPGGIIPDDPAIVKGETGNLIRVSYTASGQGHVDPGVASIGSYWPHLTFRFTVPEPGTLWLLATGVLLVMRRRLPERR